MVARGRQSADQCEAQADQKKLAGAARTSFTKKCVADAGG
ncbi:MAG: PsiF family protein [Burkholderiales bacterium]|nr:PsiF family protein [Burkholderiales bacterium]